MSTRDDLELVYLRAMRDWLREKKDHLRVLVEPDVPGNWAQKAKAEEAYERYEQAADAFLGRRKKS